MQPVTKSFKTAWRMRCKTRRGSKERKWLKRQANRSFRRFGRALCDGGEPKKGYLPVTAWDVV